MAAKRSKAEKGHREPAGESPGTKPRSHTQKERAGDLTADLGELERDVAELRAIAEERDRIFERLQRVTAELENYRKRMQREREQWRQYALEGFLRDFLATLDNFERARQAAVESGDLERLLEGLELVERELRQVLSRHGVTPIEALGLPFDPFEHEAVETEPAGDDVASGTVTAVLQAGYRLYDRVLRPAGVRVAQGLEAQKPPSRKGETGEEPRQESGAELDIT